MAQVSARMAAALARQTPKAANMAKQAPTMAVAARQFSASATQQKSKAALSEISSILEERILDDTVADQLKKGSNELLVELFANHPGQSAPAEEKGKGGKGGKKKAGGFKTVSSGYRDQLNNL